MKLSYKWIKDYVDVDADPETLAKRLTMAGSEVGSIDEVNGDSVMELEITSNRPDCLNMLGLAREAAAVFGKEVKCPKIKKKDNKEGKSSSVKYEIKEPSLCPRYTGRVIRNLKVKESSGKISERLESLGMRKVNNVVDVTNFCLMENGQPLHAFDLGKVKGLKIEIRLAKKGERIITIDGVERELNPEMLVIADQEKPIAIAGVMGGKGTEVTYKTENILLESAYFDPVSIRRTSRALGLSTDSSYRFERGVDKGAVRESSDRAMELILDLSGGETGEIYDSGPYGEELKKIELDVIKAGEFLGTKLGTEETSAILERLGMDVSRVSERKLKVTIPSFREDIAREVDLIEEVARIYGYDNIPDTVPTPAAWSVRKSHAREATEKIKKLLCAMGFSEIMTYSLISEKAARNFEAFVKEPVKIMNPLSAEQEMLTPHIIDGMMKSVAWNLNRGNKDLMFFEIGKIYQRTANADEKFREIPVLCLGMTGSVAKNWLEGEKKADIYRLKGVLQNLAEHMRICLDFGFGKIDGLINAAELSIDNLGIGFLGEVAQDKRELYGLTQETFIAQVTLKEFYDKAVLRGNYSPVPKFPFSHRDISVLCGNQVTASSIKEVVEKNGSHIVEKVEIVDMYKGKQIPPDKKSVTLSVTYGLKDRTLTEAEIEDAHSKIKSALVSQLNVSFR